MGPGEPPLLPNYEFLGVPEEQRAVTKIFYQCNYLAGQRRQHRSGAPVFFASISFEAQVAMQRVVRGADATDNALLAVKIWRRGSKSS
jgi:hypothetical protein